MAVLMVVPALIFYILLNQGRSTEYFFAWTVTLLKLITSTDFYTKWLAFIVILAILFVAGLLGYALLSGGSDAQLIIVGILGVGLALESAVTLVHWVVTHRIKPQSLPRTWPMPPKKPPWGCLTEKTERQ